MEHESCPKLILVRMRAKKHWTVRHGHTIVTRSVNLSLAIATSPTLGRLWPMTGERGGYIGENDNPTVTPP